jgi:hypothetical protein
MCELQPVQWDEVSENANSLFRVWTDGRELQWAKKSWQALSKRGLTSYANQVERTFVIIRFIALADIYRNFCDLAFDEAHEPEYMVWADEMNLEAFRVAQCIGPQFRCDEGSDTEDLFDQALCELVEGSKKVIYGALKAEFGDDSLLFVSLWNTVEREKDEDDIEGRTSSARADGEIDWTEGSYEILNLELTGQKQQAFNWVRQGFSS